MRRLTIFKSTLIGGLSAFALPALAADLGTYRPGTPYQSVVAPGADVCESHCSGDAQCRGWNYVKANPRAPGVCEFISTLSTPIPSQLSISGVNVAAQDPIAARLSPGGTNTVRVGTAVAPKPAPRITQPTPQRRIVREAVPQRINPQQSATRRVVRPQNPAMRQTMPQQQRPQQMNPHMRQPMPQRARPNGYPQSRMPQQPQFRPMLDGTNQIRQPQQAPRSQTMAPRAPEQNRRRPTGPRQGMAPQAPQQAGQMMRPQGQMQQRQMQQRQMPPQMQQQRQARAAIPNSNMMPRASAEAPVTHKNAQAAMAQRQAQVQAQIQAQMSAQAAQESLFGSLNDDVAVPAANMAVPMDPNAPIPTAQSRPTAPVQAEPLPGLAGGPL